MGDNRRNVKRDRQMVWLYQDGASFESLGQRFGLTRSGAAKAIRRQAREDGKTLRGEQRTMTEREVILMLADRLWVCSKLLTAAAERLGWDAVEVRELVGELRRQLRAEGLEERR